MTEDEPPPGRKSRVIEHPLATWSVLELQEYIAALQAEISRAEAAITRKQDHRQAAESFFRRPEAPS